MTIRKIHTQFDNKTNALLDELFAEWTLADNRADRASYENDVLNTEADLLGKQYDTLLANAKATRQPHQIEAGHYDTTYTFRTAETAQKFAQAVNGQVDGRVVKTTASLWDIDSAIARNMILCSEILGYVQFRKLQPFGSGRAQ